MCSKSSLLDGEGYHSSAFVISFSIAYFFFLEAETIFQNNIVVS